MFKKRLQKKLEDIFLPYKNSKDFMEKIEENFKKKERSDYGLVGKYVVTRHSGKNIVIVSDDKYSIIFVEGKKDLVILFITDYKGYYNQIRPSDIETKSSTRIDIIATKEWMMKNKELLEIVDLISNNTSHIGKEYITKENYKIKGFKNEYLKSPILWYLLKDRLTGVPYKKNASAKTKNNFVSGVLNIVQNSLIDKKDIMSKDLTLIKEAFYKEVTLNLLQENFRDYCIEDLETRNGLIFEKTLYPKLFESVKYNKEDWNMFFKGELYPYFKTELLDYIFNITLAYDDGTKNENIYKAILKIIENNKAYKKRKSDRYIYINNEEIKRFLLKDNRIELTLFIEKFIIFIDGLIKDDILDETYKRRHNRGNIKLNKIEGKWIDEFSERLCDFFSDKFEHKESKIMREGLSNSRTQVAQAIPYAIIDDEEEIAF